jgi:hypothetical protein
LGRLFFSNISYLGYQAVLALGFVKVPDKSVARSSDGPGEELTKLIKKLCAAKSLIVQDDKLKSVIEKELVSIFC